MLSPMSLPPPPPPQPTRLLGLSGTAIAALIASASGFLLQLSYSSYRTENGVQVDCDYRDFAPLLVGPIAIVLGAITLARSSNPGLDRSRELAIGGICLALGVLHFARGLGIVDFSLYSNPC